MHTPDESSVDPAGAPAGLLEGQLRVFEQLAAGARQEQVLDLLCQVIEAQDEDVLCSVLLLDDSGTRLHHGSGPSLPAAYNAAIDGTAIGPTVGSCGTAAFRNEPVVVTDIATDPLWADYRDLALRFDLRACWSTPIRARTGAVLGTFAIYYRTTRGPRPFERQLVETATHIAGLILERYRHDKERDLLLVRERAAREAAEAANRAKDDFLATVSHELRTPLAPILAWAGLLRTQQPKPDVIVRAAQAIERCARQESELVGDLLDLSRITAGKLRIERRTIDILDPIRGALEVVRPAAEARQVILRLEAIAVDGQIDGDSDRLQQVFWNLLANAVKFTPGGGAVTIRIQRAAQQLVVTVTDTGEGIDAEFLPHVFEPFRQSDTSFSRRHAGLGLGLSIVRHLIQLHGGTVEAASDGYGCGATFTVTLPTGLAGAGATGGPALRA